MLSKRLLDAYSHFGILVKLCRDNPQESVPFCTDVDADCASVSFANSTPGRLALPRFGSRSRDGSRRESQMTRCSGGPFALRRAAHEQLNRTVEPA